MKLNRLMLATLMITGMRATVLLAEDAERCGCEVVVVKETLTDNVVEAVKKIAKRCVECGNPEHKKEDEEETVTRCEKCGDADHKPEAVEEEAEGNEVAAEQE